MSKSLAIAIDGPAASGKSTLAKSLAERLGYLYFDTGALYRAVTLAALQRKVALEDGEALASLAQELTIEILPSSQEDGRLYDVFMDEEDSTWAIRLPEVDANVSQVSAYAGVREALKEQQRRIGLRGGVVMAGRDIGTVVLPEADIKFYLDASVEERARRRFAEYRARGENGSLEEVENSMRQRDRIDSSRVVAPLRRAEDAVILKSDTLLPLEVLEKAVQHVRNKLLALEKGN